MQKRIYHALFTAFHYLGKHITSLENKMETTAEPQLFSLPRSAMCDRRLK